MGLLHLSLLAPFLVTAPVQRRRGVRYKRHPCFGYGGPHVDSSDRATAPRNCLLESNMIHKGDYLESHSGLVLTASRKSSFYAIVIQDNQTNL